MSNFQIPDPGQAATSGTATVFTVTNVADELLEARVSIPDDPEQLKNIGIPVDRAAKAEWFTFDGPRERDFAAGAGTTVAVTPTVPPGTAPGDYLFCLQVASIEDPDNDSARSPVVTLTVAAAAPPPKLEQKPKWWLWLLIALAVLAALGVGGWLLLRDKVDDGGKVDPVVVPSSTWFVGTWTGTIDGRPATLTWKDNGEKKKPRFTGSYTFTGSSGAQPLSLVAGKGGTVDFKAGTHAWQLTKVNERTATGWASFDGERYPIALRK